MECSTLCLCPCALSSPSKVAGSAAFKGRLLMFSKLTQFTEIQHTRSNGALITEHQQIHFNTTYFKFVLRPPFFIFLLLFSHSPSHKSHPSTPIQTVKNILQSFEAPFPSQQSRFNVGCLETTQNLAPNWSVRVLHSAGRRLATLLCKLRIIRQSEF